METGQLYVERRKWPRAEFSAMAHVFVDNQPSKILGVNNLSAGGALLIGDAGLNIGDKIKLTIELPEFRLLHLTARVLRNEIESRGETAYAVAFYNIDPKAEDVIHNTVLARLEAAYRSQPPNILLLRSCKMTKRALIHDLEKLERNVIAVDNDRDAIELLRKKNYRFDVFFIDLTRSDSHSACEQILSFLADTYPSIRRIAIMSQDTLGANKNLKNMLKNTHAVLNKPWKKTSLINVLKAA